MVNLGKRIMVMGSSGSGKSTMARQLGEALGLPVVHGDTLSYQPGWVQTPRDELERTFRAVAAQREWVIDGNYRKRAFEYRFERADTVIFLDFNRFTCLYRVFKRRVMYHNKTRPDMGKGCNERITWWLAKWIWTYPKRTRGSVIAWLGEIKPPKQVYHLKGSRAVREFLREIKKGGCD